MWFLINKRRPCFTVEEYALVTDLSFEMSSFDVSTKHELQHVTVSRDLCHLNKIYVVVLVNRLCDWNIHIDDADDSLYICTAYIIVLYRFLLSWSEKIYRSVSLGINRWLRTIRNISIGRLYVLLYAPLLEWPAMQSKKKYHFYGLTLVLLCGPSRS